MTGGAISSTCAGRSGPCSCSASPHHCRPTSCTRIPTTTAASSPHGRQWRCSRHASKLSPGADPPPRLRRRTDRRDRRHRRHRGLGLLLAYGSRRRPLRRTRPDPYLLPLSVDGLVLVASISLYEIAARIRAENSPPLPTTAPVTDDVPSIGTATSEPPTPTPTPPPPDRPTDQSRGTRKTPKDKFPKSATNAQIAAEVTRLRALDPQPSREAIALQVNRSVRTVQRIMHNFDHEAGVTSRQRHRSARTPHPPSGPVTSPAAPPRPRGGSRPHHRRPLAAVRPRSPPPQREKRAAVSSTQPVHAAGCWRADLRLRYVRP